MKKQVSNSEKKSPRIAIVHDWLVGGGAEKVVEQLHLMYPDAPIYTSYATPEWRRRLDNKVKTGYLGLEPFGKIRKFLAPLRALWFRSLDLSSYDLVIASKGNGEASYVKPRPDTKFVVYCHSPTHFYWRKRSEYLKNPGFGWLNWLAKIGLRLLSKPMKSWDYRSMQRPDIIIANSTYIQSEIKRCYGRNSVVVWPPVDITRFRHHSKTRHGYITIGRQVPYKRFDLVVQAANSLSLSLTVMGQGPENSKLKALAGRTVKFIDSPSDQEISQALSSSEGFIYAANEDFGITPVEALASGTPLIVLSQGGASDYVIDGKTGVGFGSADVESIIKALKEFENYKFSPRKLSDFASTFSPDNFRARITGCIDKL